MGISSISYSMNLESEKHKDDKKMDNVNIRSFRILIVFLLVVLVCLLLNACTMNFSNVSTSGKADEIADDTSKVEASPTVTVPVKPL